ncbi:MAG TPA: hypothetical protein VMV92_45460 [Streptosporangiaceae bacterium]|nr:hypothetical protein [Streptosporangiaceae bacterium]
MLTVCNDAARVERMLEDGVLTCPPCGGVLRKWGYGRRRSVFGPGREPGPLFRPRRSRCPGCGATHVLLPARLLLRRADAGAVIGEALVLAAGGRGSWAVAAALKVPPDTARRWLRRFRGRAGQVREFFTRLAAALAADPVPLEPAGSLLGDAVVAVAAAADAAWSRWPLMSTVAAWELASAVTSGTLLSPDAVFARLGDDLSVLAVT